MPLDVGIGPLLFEPKVPVGHRTSCHARVQPATARTGLGGPSPRDSFGLIRGLPAARFYGSVQLRLPVFGLGEPFSFGHH